jgi:putative transposase
MKKQRYREEQIVKILQEAENTGNTRETARKHNVSEQTIYRWRQVYGGMEVSDVKKMKSLETENSRLKKIVADLSLDIAMLKEINSKKW